MKVKITKTDEAEEAVDGIEKIILTAALEGRPRIIINGLRVIQEAGAIMATVAEYDPEDRDEAYGTILSKLLDLQASLKDMPDADTRGAHILRKIVKYCYNAMTDAYEGNTEGMSNYLDSASDAVDVFIDYTNELEKLNEVDDPHLEPGELNHSLPVTIITPDNLIEHADELAEAFELDDIEGEAFKNLVNGKLTAFGAAAFVIMGRLGRLPVQYAANGPADAFKRLKKIGNSITNMPKNGWNEQVRNELFEAVENLRLYLVYDILKDEDKSAGYMAQSLVHITKATELLEG
jgi:hypothetical protein